MTSYAHTILPPREGRGLPRWGIAALVVFAIHFAIGAFIILTHRSDMPPGTVMIDLAPVAAAPSLPPELSAPPKPTPPKPTPPKPALPKPALPKPASVLPLPEAATPPPQPVAGAGSPELTSVPDKTQAQNRIETQKRVDHERLRKAGAARPRMERANSAASPRTAHRAAGPEPGAAPQSMSSWARQVLARVNAAKRYPGAARAWRESGTATLTFTVDAGGRVVAAGIASSSGSSVLDNATLSMAHRLGRLPPPPNGRVTVRVPVHFSLR